MNHRILLTIFSLAHIATSFGQDNEQYTNCSILFQCGNFPGLGYPFWGGNRPNYCGHPSFQTSCRGNSPIINIKETPYRVLAVNDSSQTVTVVGEDFQDRRFCPSSPQNITLDQEHFEYALGFPDLRLYYGCRAQGNIPISTQFPCSSLGDNTFAVYTADGLGNPFEGGNIPLTCGPSISVPINGTLAQGLQNGTRNQVNITQVLDNGFGLVWKANNTDCDVCGRSGGRCGSDSGSFICYCRDQAHPVTCNSIQSSPGTNKWKNWLMVTIACVVSALGVGILVVCLIMCWRRRTKNDPNLENLIKQHGYMALKRYSYSDIKKMTNSFKDKLGQGGFGSVYKGKLPDGHLVAVKILNVLKGNGEDFINEVASISMTSNVNVVTLKGYCLQGNKRALVYDLMPHGSLEKFLCNKSTGEVGLARLDRETLYKITIGIARGLEYLHSGCNTRILHFDIKPHNILLDEDFCPKISDFGLAKLCTGKESIVSMVGTRGTVGYIAPEVFCRNFGGVSYKSDVYSYGMMVLEMVGARKKLNNDVDGSSECYFPQWIYKLLEAGGDLELQADLTKEENELTKKMTMVGLWCIQTHPSQRPTMGRVLDMLEGSVERLEFPPQPFLSSPSKLVEEYSTTVTLS